MGMYGIRSLSEMSKGGMTALDSGAKMGKVASEAGNTAGAAGGAKGASAYAPYLNYAALGGSLLDGDFKDPNTLDAAFAFVPYAGWANSAIGGINTVAGTSIPTFGSMASKVMGGGKGSATNKIAQQMMADKENRMKKVFNPFRDSTNRAPGLMRQDRVGSVSLGSLRTELDAWEGKADDIIGGSRFGEYGDHVKRGNEIMQAIADKYGKGGGSGRPLPKSEMGTQRNVKLPNQGGAMEMSRGAMAALNLGQGKRNIYENKASSVQVKRTPGNYAAGRSRNITNLNNILQSRSMSV